MKVWLAWTGDYENRGVDGVYASREAAIEGTKRTYGPPYKVEWTLDSDGYLVGTFESVPGYSTNHRASWGFEEWEVEESSPSR